MTDAHREQQFCEWLLTPLFQSRNGKSLWCEKLTHFEVRLGRRWKSFVCLYTKPLTINGGLQIAPFELKQECDCKYGWWGCLCSDLRCTS
jgi:hypothetical protein